MFSGGQRGILAKYKGNPRATLGYINKKAMQSEDKAAWHSLPTENNTAFNSFAARI